MRRPVAFDPNNLNRNKGRRRGKISVDVDAANLTGSLTFYSPPEPPEGGYIIISDSNTAIGIAAGSAKPVFWTADDSTIVNVVSGLPGNNTSISTTADAFSYLASNNYYVLTSKGGNTVSDTLVLELNASHKNSYPTTGTTWYDLSGNGNNGTLTNGPSFNSNGYITFDGSNDVVTIPNSTSLNPTTGLTIEAWVNFDGNSDDFIFEKGNVNTQFSLFSHGTDIVFRTKHSGDSSYHTQSPSKTSVGIVNGQWHHIVGSWDGSTKRIYIDGVLKNSVSKSGNLVTTTPGASIGRFGGTTTGYYFNGGISVVRVYSKGLSQSEILQNYYETSNVPSNAKIIVDTTHPISVNSSGLNFDLAKQYNNLNTWGYADSDLGTDFDGMTEFTYCLWLHCYSHHTSYSQTPFYKYSGTSTAVVRLYDFGNYNGNNDNGSLRFYMNRGGTWSHVGNTYKMSVGETAFIALQFNSTNSGQMWVNGQKQGTRSGGTGAIATNTADFGIITPEYGGEQFTKVKAAYVYNHELTDQEITDLYTSTQAKHGL